MGADPTSIRSIAVRAEDVVDAFVYSRENPASAVLRVTPPFHGRMRARLHVYHVDDAPETGAIHVDPADLLDPSVVDAFPTMDAYEDRLAETGDPAGIRETRAEDLAAWREEALDGLVETVAVETDIGRPEATDGAETTGDADATGSDEATGSGEAMDGAEATNAADEAADAEDGRHDVSVARLG